MLQLTQIFSIALFNLRSITEREGAALTAAIGIAGVVAIFSQATSASLCGFMVDT